MIDNVRATGAILTSSITGIPGSAVRDVSLSNIRIETAEGGKREWIDRKIPEKTNAYPEARMFGRLCVLWILLPSRERFADGQRRSGLQRAGRTSRDAFRRCERAAGHENCGERAGIGSAGDAHGGCRGLRGDGLCGAGKIARGDRGSRGRQPGNPADGERFQRLRASTALADGATESAVASVANLHRVG